MFFLVFRFCEFSCVFFRFLLFMLCFFWMG